MEGRGDKKKSASKSTKTNMEDGAATARGEGRKGERGERQREGLGLYLISRFLRSSTNISTHSAATFTNTTEEQPSVTRLF